MEGESRKKYMRINKMPLELQAKQMFWIKKSVEKMVPVLVMGPPCSGKTTLVQLAASELGISDPLTINVGEQADAKPLLGAYTVAAGRPGRFKWRAGVILEAALSGKWLILEDLQLASSDFISIIRPLLDSRQVFSPLIGETVSVHSGFRLFATASSREYSLPISRSFWAIIKLDELDQSTLLSLISESVDHRLLTEIITQLKVPSTLIFRLADRLAFYGYGLTDDDRLSILADCIDVFAGSWKRADRVDMITRLSHILNIPTGAALDCVLKHVYTKDNTVSVGRITLDVQQSLRPPESKFVMTRLSSNLLEQVACCVQVAEPVLLVGETGTGKTAIVQFLARLAGASFVAVNMSQQSEASDLLGGFRPLSPQVVARQLTDKFINEFGKTFSKSKNAAYLDAVIKSYKDAEWVRLARLIRQIFDRLKTHPELPPNWASMESHLDEFEQCNNGLVFHFQEGTLVEAIQRGHWILLDEINLATPETLNLLSGLLRDSSASITLTERGDTSPIPRHPNFRLFACMNPATDVGKKDLPASIRRRFTELYVDEADVIEEDLLTIIQALLGPALGSSDDSLPSTVASLYYEWKEAVNSGVLSDGNRKRPLFNLRTLTRPIRFAVRTANLYGIRQALREGFSLAFLTQLDTESRAIASSILDKHLPKQPNSGRLYCERWTRNPAISVFDRYVIETGPRFDRAKSLGQLMSELENKFVLTESVRQNMMSIARAVMAGDYPILLEGPTSTGKTSSIEYLALLTGHQFVRINNHEHTDLQEYIGSHVIGPSGQLEFKEGLLLTALREGYWLVLDELNIAPTDVLEALNRLLDDNRELYVAELNEVVKPHPHFRLFATQNPAGSVYGGRKVLSRAFRSRFIEICVLDIPVEELETILSRKAQIAPSQAKKLAQVYLQLRQERAASANLFAGRHALVTLRELFRWAGRPHVTNEDLARNGYICLAERMRNDADKDFIAQVIGKVFKMSSVEPLPYQLMPDMDLPSSNGIVWTAAMKRLYWLALECVRAREPVLLIGETGCGKTTIVQLLAEALSRELIILNCHQNTEASDLLGSQRPARADSDELFTWRDGPLVQAMRHGKVLLIDEISLADDSVLERLNSILEPGRSLTLAEAPESPQITAHPHFCLLATMNPGGDYGKKELSPALRSRFTEIWVPVVADLADIEAIIMNRLDDSNMCKMIMDFWVWYRQQPFGQMLSLRDLGTWIQFIERNGGQREAFIHGAEMLFVDRLEDHSLQHIIISQLEAIASIKRLAIDYHSIQYSSDESTLSIGPFSVECSNKILKSRGHQFNAPTTFKSAVRTARAMRLSKPILLEGSPGVGKTALVAAMAAACGDRLCRINLSEQTDLGDLFGADLPVDGESPGQFAWRDGPFLAALKSGDWILLDELNLASQSVLEGLNACLDHRQTVYIPELDRSFSVSQQSRIFAAQNPVSQGGGRKGLPRSFLSRFTIVWFDELTDADYDCILRGKYPNVDGEWIKKAIVFNSRLNKMIADDQLGKEGRPWEFNLRDLFRWFDLMTPADPLYPLKMIYMQRFRTESDRLIVGSLAKEVFGYTIQPLVWSINDCTVQIGSHRLARPTVSNKQLLHSQKDLLDSVLTAITANMVIILTGPSGSGKSSLIEMAAELRQRKVHSIVLGPDTDSLDLLGSFEQVNSGQHQEGCFEWVDGPLVRAVGQGFWLVLDHANSASPSVLDRINSLLELNGVLVLSEQGVSRQTGQVRTIIPHPEFRLFMTVQTDSRAEISRAMRNRGVELYVPKSGILDQLAVIRSASQVAVNQDLMLTRVDNLREAHRSGLFTTSGPVELEGLTDTELYWRSCQLRLPLSIADGPDHIQLFKEIALTGTRDLLKEGHLKFGFEPCLRLLFDYDPITSFLHPSGTVWRAALQVYNQTDLLQYTFPEDEGFMKKWRSDYLPLAIKNEPRAKLFELMSRMDLPSEAYVSLWREGNTDLVMSVGHSDLGPDGFDELLKKAQEYALVRNGDASVNNSLLCALNQISPLLKRVYLMSVVFRDLQMAKKMLNCSYLSVLCEGFLTLYSSCSISQHEKCFSMIDDLKAVMKSAIKEGGMAFEGYGDCHLMPIVQWIVKNGDPNEHLLIHSRILGHVADLQSEECALQRKFLLIVNGFLRDEEGMVRDIASVKSEADRSMKSCIEPSVSRQSVLAILRNAEAFTSKLASPSEHLAPSLLGFRHSLCSLPANCFDLTIPLIHEIDGMLVKCIPVSDISSQLDPVSKLRATAIRACHVQSPVPVDRLPWQELFQFNRPIVDNFHGVREDGEIEREIETQFFAARDYGIKSANTDLTICNLLSLCARPDHSAIHQLQAEQAFHQAFTCKDSNLEVDLFFEHLVYKSGRNNFYHDPQPAVLMESCLPVQQLASHVGGLLEEYPGHDVLENILAQCNRYLLNLPINQTTLAAATIALERILQKTNDWEQYAAKSVSLQQEIASLVAVIIKYRRIELESWKSVFGQVQEEYRIKACSNWPQLAKLILITSASVDESLFPEIVTLMEEYLMSGQLGQFAHRLSLLEDLVILCLDKSLKSVLGSVVHYFKPLSAHLDALIQAHREPLESGLRAYLKTVHWSDTTYWAVRSSVERSHRRMAQFVRKIRDLLDRPVSSVLASTLFKPSLNLLGNRLASTPLDILCDCMEERMAELRQVDDVAMKQRAALDFLSELKSLGFKLTNRNAFERAADTKTMLIAAGLSGVDLSMFANCLHQFVCLRSTTNPHPDLGVRVIESFQAVSGQLIACVIQAMTGVDAAISSCGWLIEEGLHRLSNTEGQIVDLHTAKQLLYDDRVSPADYVRLVKAQTSVVLSHRLMNNVRHPVEDHSDISSLLNMLRSAEDEWNGLLESQDFVNGASGWLHKFVSSASHLRLFSGSRSALGKANKLLEQFKIYYGQFKRSLHKLVFVLLSVLGGLLQDGYCRKDGDQREQSAEQEPKEQGAEQGTGMAEGGGEKNVNEEMEFEEQLIGLQSDQKTPEEDRPEKEDNELEMQQDFDAELEKLLIDDSQEEDQDEEEDYDDKQADNIDSDAEQQEMDGNWSDEAEDLDDVSIDPENGETKDELMAGEYNNEVDEDDRQDLNSDDSGGESEDEHEPTDELSDGGGHVEEVESIVADSEDDPSETRSIQNPNADDREDDLDNIVDDSRQQQQMSPDTQQPTSRKLDSLGADALESGVGESNVVEEQIGASRQSVNEPAPARTIHEIIQPQLNSPLDPHGAGDHQLYEHAPDNGQVVAGRSDECNNNINQSVDNAISSTNTLQEQTKSDTNTDNQILQSDGQTINREQPSVVGREEEYKVVSDLVASRSLSYELCERLRLVLEPTERTRMQGDYKTGKRLNLRKIIPFIASGYRRDRIWLRRTRPARRNYHITLGVDQSKSMRDGEADRLALITVEALEDGLRRLESGTVEIIGFGESVRRFSSVAEMDRFADETSNFAQLLEYLLVRNDSTASEWSLAIIISDGICQDHPTIRALVNKCLQSRILPLLVIIDPQHRISELSQVEYQDGAVLFTKYLSSLPFEHYLVVHELQHLPQLLADAIQQWFQALID